MTSMMAGKPAGRGTLTGRQQLRGMLLPRLFLIMLAAAVAGCSGLPKNTHRPETSAFSNTADTSLGAAAARLSAGRKSDSGFIPLSEGLDAFAARVILAQNAERSLDLQYYIWRDDQAGKLLGAALFDAAERGVRVRLLLDDIGLDAPDRRLLSFDDHPNIEIRLFNPVVHRNTPGMSALLSFRRINRRMHNKAFIADNQFCIVGGRNIGAEYFDADTEVNFDDFDVLATGPVAQEVSDSFDLYWNSEYAIPVAEIVTQPAEPLEQIAAELEQHLQTVAGSRYVQALKESNFQARIRNGSLPLYWGQAHVVYDDPAKLGVDRDEQDTHLLTRLKPLLDEVEEEAIIISAYFIPGKQGTRKLTDLARRGVRVRVLTNSLAATDVGAVYAGYAKYRLPLLQAGVELYESKPAPDAGDRNRREQKFTASGSSRTALHTKIYVFDRNEILVGSLNLDPRSREINTELGVLFENRDFGNEVASMWENNIDSFAYELKLSKPESATGDEAYSLYWQEQQGQKQKIDHVGPETGFWRRFGVGVMRILPIESQL